MVGSNVVFPAGRCLYDDGDFYGRAWTVSALSTCLVHVSSMLRGKRSIRRLHMDIQKMQDYLAGCSLHIRVRALVLFAKRSNSQRVSPPRAEHVRFVSSSSTVQCRGVPLPGSLPCLPLLSLRSLVLRGGYPAISKVVGVFDL